MLKDYKYDPRLILIDTLRKKLEHVKNKYLSINDDFDNIINKLNEILSLYENNQYLYETNDNPIVYDHELDVINKSIENIKELLDDILDDILNQEPDEKNNV